MVLACERIFSRTRLDARPQKLDTFSKVDPKYTQHTCQVVQARYRLYCEDIETHNLDTLINKQWQRYLLFEISFKFKHMSYHDR